MIFENRLLSCCLGLHSSTVASDMIASVSSFYEQQKSVDNIYEELEEVYHTFAWLNYNGRMLTVKYPKFFEEKAKGLVGLTPEEKYKRIVEKEPEILLRIPSRYLAAHLGINETMSSKTGAKWYIRLTKERMCRTRMKQSFPGTAIRHRRPKI